MTAATFPAEKFAAAGRLTAITAGNDSDKDNVADLSYTWDDIGNLTSRSDNIETYTENFCYDALNRLTSYALFDGGGSSACSGGTINKSVGYDAEFPNGIGDGNITSKSDLGVYTYGQFGAGPHAVTSINTTGPSNGGCTLSRCLYDGISNPNLFYDADGNIHCVTTRTSCNSGAARTYAFTSFDMVETIQQGTGTTSIGYSPEHQRGELTTPSGTLYYFSNPVAGVMEELAPGGTQWNTYLVPYGHLVAEMFTAGGTTTPYYFTGDHLTSTTALTDQNGNQTEADSYDAWGNRRLPSGVDKATGCNQNPSPPSKTTRGFTSQEELDKLCLVNLNARLYDPALGRMMSGDSIVPDPFDGQSFNRYSYVDNEPTSAIDPSGHDLTLVCGQDSQHCHYIGGVGSAMESVSPDGNGSGSYGGDAGFGGGGDTGGDNGDGSLFTGDDNPGGLLSMGNLGDALVDATPLVSGGLFGNPFGNPFDTCYAGTCVGSFSQDNQNVTPETVTVFGYFYPDPLYQGLGGWTANAWSQATSDRFTNALGCYWVCLGYALTKSGNVYMEVGFGNPQIGVSTEWTSNADAIVGGPALNVNYSLVSASVSLPGLTPASGGGIATPNVTSGGVSVTYGILLGTTQDVAAFVSDQLNNFSLWPSFPPQ